MNSLPTIHAIYTANDFSPIELDHADWNRAQGAPLTQYWSGEPAPPNRHAEARVLWSDTSICVRFVCRQKEPLIVSSTPQTERKTMGLWDRDVCEAFFAPNPEQPERYFEFEAAPTGEWLDLAVVMESVQRETEWSFESGMTTAARVDKEQLTVAMRIPWTERIPQPLGGDQWRINLFRCVGSGINRGYLAWQPTHTERPNFHIPAAFGWLVFEY
jgi:alpha-galactosidase